LSNTQQHTELGTLDEGRESKAFARLLQDEFDSKKRDLLDSH